MPIESKEEREMYKVPTGTILPFYGGDTHKPKGFLFCDGKEISKQDYKELYDLLIEANIELRTDENRVRLPDLRGEFLRGWDNRRNVDANRSLGSWQADEIESHTHRLKRTTTGPESNSTYVNWYYMGPTNDKGSTDAITPYGGDETRPRNISINFIIKT